MTESDDTAPAQFYTGVVAELYRHLRASTFDPAPYAKLIRRYGEPALELGCGDGDPLLDLVSEGLLVEGLDSSEDMLARCRSFAAQRGLDVTLHNSTMEAMNLGRQFKTIYLAGPTFNLLPTDAIALEALSRIRSHLVPGGVALVPLTVPSPTPATYFGRPRVHRSDDVTEMRFSVLSERRDPEMRIQANMLRYEYLVHDDVTECVDREWVLHWYSPAQFFELVSAAGLEPVWVRTPDRSRLTESSTAFTFLLTPRDAPASS